MYDAAEEARKKELNQAAIDRMALKEFESMGRGKAEARRRENEEERQRIREEVEENDERYWEKHNLDIAIFLRKLPPVSTPKILAGPTARNC